MVDIHVDDHTLYETAGAPGKSEDLKVGVRVVVHCESLADGRVQATKVRRSDVASGAGRSINSIMRDGPSRIALVLVALLSPLVAFAQQGMPMGHDGMMWGSPYGGGGVVLMVLVALLLLAATGALIAFTVFLLQRSRPRAPLDT